MLAPDPLSLVPRQLEMIYDAQDYNTEEVYLSLGVVFIYEHCECTYLITNLHNVSGRHYRNGEILHSRGAIPNKVSLRLGKPNRFVKDRGIKRETITWEEITIDLWDENKDPLWLEHPEHGNDVDVMALALPREEVEEYHCFPINRQDLDAVHPRISEEAFILGYPLSIGEPSNLPVWKRATIATEPGGEVEDLPKVYLDTKTAKGMSGAPVVIQRRGVYGNPETDVVPGESWDFRRSFLGVYSGRLGEDPFEAQLGIAWKKEVITKIIEGEVRGEPRV